MSKLPVSVCMISGAEAHRIGPALESVAEWTNEIVVVLNEEVRDGTEELALRYGAKVFREQWKGYVAQINSAAEKGRCDWLLGLDADERVSPPLRAEIISALEHEAKTPRFTAFSFPRRSFYCGRWIGHGDWYPDRKTRLWQRGKARWEGVDPHYALEVAGPVRRLRHDLLHFSNESIEKQIAKVAKYQTEYVRRRVAAGKSAGIFGLVVRPWWRFMRAYFLRLGFLDGWQGYYIAKLSAFSSLTRQAMVREAESTKRLTP